MILPGHPGMAGGPLNAMENLHAGAGEEDIDALAHQRIGHRVEVPIDRDLIDNVNGCPDRPVADHVRLDRQALEGAAFDRFKQTAPTAPARRRHRLVVQLTE
jgi:hypothetical protein